VPALAGRGHGIDVYVHEGRVAVERNAADRPVLPGTTRVLGAHEFVWRQARHAYDLTVYQVGNSALHDFIWPYLFRWPGLAVMHDARRHHARGRALRSRGRFDIYRAEFAWSHPDVSPDVAELGVLGLGGAYLYGWPMTRAVLAASRMTVVHTRGAIDELAESDPTAIIEHVRLGEGRDARWTVSERTDARAGLGLPGDGIAFGVFGALTEERRVPQILRAFADTRRRHSHSRLVLAGAPDPAVDVAALTAQLGLSDAVHVAGVLDDESFDRAVAAVDVHLNLRWPSALETSGPWLRALAAERPTVVVDLPHLGHLPTLDPRTWRLHAPAQAGARDQDAVAVAIDILDEDHSLRLAMSRLAGDAALRETLGARARRYWESAHTVAHMVEDVDRAILRAAGLPAPTIALPAGLRPDPLAFARELVAPLGDDVAGRLDRLAGLESET